MRLRPLAAAIAMALVASACGVFAPGFEDDVCALHPIDGSESGFRIGPAQLSATSCAALVEVRGKHYTVTGADWLVQESLVLDEYGPITHSNYLSTSAPTFSLSGVDPSAMLVARFPEVAQPGSHEGLQVLMSTDWTIPESVCRYGDPTARGYPAVECSLAVGPTYHVEMITKCGMDRPMGPYGGVYWRVLDPPADPGPDAGYPGMYRDLDYGALTLTDADHAVYRSEQGAELRLERIADPSVQPEACELFEF